MIWSPFSAVRTAPRSKKASGRAQQTKAQRRAKTRR